MAPKCFTQYHLSLSLQSVPVYPWPQSSCLRNLEVPQAASRGVTLAAGGLSLRISVTTRTYLHDTLK